MAETAESKEGGNRRRARRARRAQELQRRTLSFRNIVVKLLALPLLALAIWLGAYFRTSDYAPETALAHLLALAGCDAAFAVGLAPARVGEPGYHRRNDPDGDGVACPFGGTYAEGPPVGDGNVRTVGGAKFVKP